MPRNSEKINILNFFEKYLKNMLTSKNKGAKI